MNGRRVQRLDQLAQNVPPPRDLWPAIASAIAADADASTHSQPAPRKSAWMPAYAAAASIVLVTLGVWIGRSLGPDAGASTMTAGNAADAAADSTLIPAAFQRDEKYQRTRAELLGEVEKKLATMQPAEREKVAASLATLRRSIAEIEAALGRDPANSLLQELLVNSCQEEMRALSAVREAGGQET